MRKRESSGSAEASPSKTAKRIRDRKRRKDERSSLPETKEYGKIIRKDPCAFPGCRKMSECKDHIVAFSKGGKTHWMNLTGMCAKHNRLKGNKDLLQWLLESC